MRGIGSLVDKITDAVIEKLVEEGDDLIDRIIDKLINQSDEFFDMLLDKLIEKIIESLSKD
tara:strand:- start:770 stop:952 length:183 start_codon:yes stop_codon:yes gene_type:complete